MGKKGKDRKRGAKPAPADRPRPFVLDCPACWAMHKSVSVKLWQAIKEHNRAVGAARPGRPDVLLFATWLADRGAFTVPAGATAEARRSAAQALAGELQAWLAGAKEPPAYCLAVICRILGVSVEWLLGPEPRCPVPPDRIGLGPARPPGSD